MKKIILFFLILLLAVSFSFAGSAKTIDSNAYLVYVPSGVKDHKNYPLVVAFSPDADAQSMVNTWKNVAEKYKWIIFASKEFSDGIDMNSVLTRVTNHIQTLLLEYPIDSSRVIATGLSAGATVAYVYSFLNPNLIRAVVANTGTMQESYIKKKEVYPKKKLAVLLASPDESGYKQMMRDRNFLKDLDWRVKWINFYGEDKVAPQKCYYDAARWLIEELKSGFPEEKMNEQILPEASLVMVESIFLDQQGDGIVVLNGKMFSQGDTFKGIKIERISKTSVAVMIEGQVKSFSVGEVISF